MALKKIILNGQTIELPSGGGDAEQEIELITLTNNLNAEDFALTADECASIVTAYNANKTILFKKSNLRYATGWILPNISLSKVSTMYRLYISYYIGNFYMELTVQYNTDDNTATTTINKRIDISTIGNKIVLEDTSITLEDNVMPNNVYVIPNAISTLKINISEPLEEVASMEYTIHFAVGDTIGAFTFPNELLWANGIEPFLEAGTAYELSIVASLIGGSYIYKGVLVKFSHLITTNPT